MSLARNIKYFFNKGIISYPLFNYDMVHAQTSSWKTKPGGWDKLNTELFDPVLTVDDFPVILPETISIPERLTQFRKTYRNGDALHFFVGTTIDNYLYFYV